MKPVIAITASEVTNSEYPWAPVVHGQAYTYVDAVVRAGGVPVILPIVKDKTVLRQLYEACQGLLLSGGYDIDPDNYETTKTQLVRQTSPARDRQETQLYQWALADDKPVLGVCRGMQLINTIQGGSLYHDVEAEMPAAQNHELCVERKDFRHLAHKLKVEPGSKLAGILGSETISTNSLHHQAVRDLGTDLMITARAEDSVIEALEMTGDRFVIGVQSHPEALENEVEPAWSRLFKAFVDKARARP